MANNLKVFDEFLSSCISVPRKYLFEQLLEAWMVFLRLFKFRKHGRHRLINKLVCK
jgi:hypothetical protein